MRVKTFSPKPTDLSHDWYLIDAEGKTLGRLASLIATYAMGKHKPGFSAHVDGGDNIVVINAEKIRVTGNKLETKHYYHHSGYPGGIASTNLATLLERHPAKALENAVAGMLPKNRLQDNRMARVKIYAGPDHPHAGQSPQPLGDK